MKNAFRALVCFYSIIVVLAGVCVLAPNALANQDSTCLDKSPTQVVETYLQHGSRGQLRPMLDCTVGSNRLELASMDTASELITATRYAYEFGVIQQYTSFRDANHTQFYTVRAYRKTHATTTPMIFLWATVRCPIYNIEIETNIATPTNCGIVDIQLDY